MYKCGGCLTLYDLSEENLDYISDEAKINQVSETIVKCPACEKKRIVGGELDYDEFEDHEIINMFGRELTEEDLNKGLKEFEGVKQ